MILKSVLLSVLLAVIVTAPWAVASSSQARAAVQPHICLDAGHGGREPGAVKDLGDGELLREADINLDIALYLEQEWDGLYQVTMTRSTDDTLSTRQRYEACNASGADILVSVHMNSVADTAVDGSLAIYFQNDDRVLAEALYESMWAELQPTAPEPNTFRDFGVKKDALGIVLKSDMPAAVVEPVMMSHDGEAALLATTISECLSGGMPDCRRLQIADAITQGVSDYFSAPAPPPEDGGGSGPPPCKGQNRNDPGCP